MYLPAIMTGVVPIIRTSSLLLAEDRSSDTWFSILFHKRSSHNNPAADPVQDHLGHADYIFDMMLKWYEARKKGLGDFEASVEYEEWKLHYPPAIE